MARKNLAPKRAFEWGLSIKYHAPFFLNLVLLPSIVWRHVLVNTVLQSELGERSGNQLRRLGHGDSWRVGIKKGQSEHLDNHVKEEEEGGPHPHSSPGLIQWITSSVVIKVKRVLLHYSLNLPSDHQCYWEQSRIEKKVERCRPLRGLQGSRKVGIILISRWCKQANIKRWEEADSACLPACLLTRRRSYELHYNLVQLYTEHLFTVLVPTLPSLFRPSVEISVNCVI